MRAIIFDSVLTYVSENKRPMNPLDKSVVIYTPPILRKYPHLRRVIKWHLFMPIRDVFIILMR